MLKRGLLAITGLLALLVPARAADLTFTNVFDELFKFLGPQGTDFLMAFAIVSTLVYMAVSNVPFFKGSASAKMGGALFAMIAGLATGFYVYTTKFPFLAAIGPYFMLLIAIMLGLILIYVIRSVAGGASLASSLGIGGLGALIIGILIAVFSPPLAAIGVFVAIIGGALMVIGGASWMTGKGELGIFGGAGRREEVRRGRAEEHIEEDVIRRLRFCVNASVGYPWLRNRINRLLSLAISLERLFRRELGIEARGYGDIRTRPLDVREQSVLREMRRELRSILSLEQELRSIPRIEPQLTAVYVEITRLLRSEGVDIRT